MRFSNFALLALPALVVAEEQVPLMDKVKGFFNKAQSIVSSAVPTMPSPVDAGAAKVAEVVVSPLTLENWKSVLAPSAASAVKSEPEHWMVYIDGGNKTCYGFCGNATRAWNQAAALLSPKSNRPNLAILDCETQGVLCNAWAVGPPSIYYMLIPHSRPDQTKAATEVHYIMLNRTSIKPADITELYTKKAYANTPAYEGVWHPFDGELQHYGLDVPIGYVIYYFSLMPSWAPMIIISMFGRSIMGRRLNQPQRTAPAGGAAPQ